MLKMTSMQLGPDDTSTPSTLTAALTLTRLSPQFQRLDPGAGDRVVTLPAEGKDVQGGNFMIEHVGTGTKALTVQDDASNTICSLVTTEIGIVFCNGVVWRGGVLKAT